MQHARTAGMRTLIMAFAFLLLPVAASSWWRKWFGLADAETPVFRPAKPSAEFSERTRVTSLQKERQMWQCSRSRVNCLCFDKNLSLAQHEEDTYAVGHFFCDVCESRRNYVEIGALDGIKYSTSIGLERQAHFGGLLIEGHPVNARALQRNRGRSGKNIIASTAVCAQEKGTVQFIGPPNVGTAGIASNMNEQYLASWGRLGRWKGKNYTVPCKPIGSIIRDAGLKLVHFFVLDVEGAELIVLQTMDWSIPVLVWTIELDGSNPTKDHAVRALLRSKGYTFFARHKINDIFVRNKKLALGRAEQCKKCATRCASA